jgi:hypothetical protein
MTAVDWEGPLGRCGGIRLVPVIVLTATVAYGCGTVTPAPSQVPHAYGEALEAGPKPAPEACQQRLRSEQLAAARIRTELRVDGVSAEPVAVKAAAADPTSDLTMLGIPLTAAEMQAIRTSGTAMDPATPLAFWVNAGAPERFGGIWIDPPGSNRYVIAIVGGDPDSLALARCIEGPDVRYVWATVSKLDGLAVADRIGADMGGWRARGVPVNSVSYDETKGMVVVGITDVTPALVQQFQAQYGPLVRLEVAGPIVPA